MSERAAFLAAICASPDEDTPRLAFADWLDEQDTKPDAFQADFIRTHCRLARATPGTPESKDLQTRFAKLATRIPPAWTAHLKGRVIASEFERGFIGHISLYSKRFVTEGDQFFATDPIRSVKFATLRSQRGSVTPAELFRCPHLSRVARLTLDGSELTDKELANLASSPHTAGLQLLSLCSEQAFTRTAMPKLLEARPGIRALYLSHNWRFGDAHLKPLAESPVLANLHTLHLDSTSVSGQGVVGFTRSKYVHNLRALKLTSAQEFDDEHGYMTGHGGSRAEGLAMAEGFAASTGFVSLYELHMSFCKLGNEGLVALGQAKHLPALRRLFLVDNGITKKGILAFALTLLGKQLSFIDLAFNGSLDRHHDAVKEAFPNAEVRLIGW